MGGGAGDWNGAYYAGRISTGAARVGWFVTRVEPWPRQLDRKLDSYSTATRQLLDRIARQSLTATRQTSTATRQKPPDSMCLGVKASSSTARQLDRPRQNSTDLDRAEPIRTSLLEPHSFKVKVDGDPLVNYTTWWLDDGFTSGGPFVPRSVCSFVLFLT